MPGVKLSEVAAAIEALESGYTIYLNGGKYYSL